MAYEWSDWVDTYPSLSGRACRAIIGKQSLGRAFLTYQLPHAVPVKIFRYLHTMHAGCKCQPLVPKITFKLIVHYLVQTFIHTIATLVVKEERVEEIGHTRSPQPTTFISLTWQVVCRSRMNKWTNGFDKGSQQENGEEPFRRRRRHCTVDGGTNYISCPSRKRGTLWWILKFNSICSRTRREKPQDTNWSRSSLRSSNRQINYWPSIPGQSSV